MTAEIDLDAYLRRIDLSAPVTADLNSLRAIVAHHAAAIPFENLNPLLGLPVQLDLASLQRKLIAERRGGYCFEHNLLLLGALHALGFEASGLAARVLWTQPEDAITPRGHMLLRVELAGTTHLVDVGFGGLTLSGVLRLSLDERQSTPHEAFRLLQRDGDYFMQAEVREAWQTLYRFDLQRQYLQDYEVTSYYLSTHPGSRFVSGLIAARTPPGRRLALRGREFAVHHLGGATERRALESVTELRAVLEDEFEIELPEVPQLQRKLERALAH